MAKAEPLPDASGREAIVSDPARQDQRSPSLDTGRTREGATSPAEKIQAAAQAKRTASAITEPLPQAPAAAASPPPPLVYIHVREETQRRQVERLVRVLPEKGIAVSGIKLVERGPEVADLRYFRLAEAGEARRVLRALEALGVHAQIKRIGGYETTATERQYELWLPPGS